MNFTSKQVEALEKIASILPDILNSIKLVESSDYRLLPLEDYKIVEDSIGELLSQTTNFFQFKDRSGEEIKNPWEDPGEDPGEDPTFKPLMDLAKQILYNNNTTQLKSKLFTTLLPLVYTDPANKLNDLSETLATVNMYTNACMVKYFSVKEEKKS